MYIVLFLSLFTFKVFAQPNPVSDLFSISGIDELKEGSVKLIWTYPGPDVLPEGSAYYIKYSSFYEVNWSTSSSIVVSTGPVNPLQQQLFVLTGLDNFVLENSLSRFTTFYFVVFISSGSQGDLSLSNIATGWMTLWLPYVEIIEANPGVHEGEVELKFQGSDDYINNTMTGILSGYYYIQYTDIEYFNNWSTSAAQIVISTFSYPSYIWSAGYLITGLSGGITYYLRIWAEDELGNLSEMSNKTTMWAQPDISPPKSITSIFVSAGFRHVKLSWVFPYEDSYEDGFLYNSSTYTGSYKIKYHTQKIYNETLWNQATEVFFITNVNITPYTSTNVVVNNLVNSSSYYFSIKIADEKLNWSLISSSSPFCRAFNSSPSCFYPHKHFVYDPVKNTTSTIISSSTVKFDWSDAVWHAGFSFSDNSYDSDYGDYISTYTLKISSYTIGNTLGAILVEVSTSATSIVVKDLQDNITYFWSLSVYDSENASSTTAIFRFTVNFQNTAPKFPLNPLISPSNTVVHTKDGSLIFDFKDAYEIDPFDYVVGYKIYLSTSENFESYITIPQEGLLTNSYFLMTPYTQPSSNELLFYENQKIYWYVVAYDSGAPFGFSQLSTQTPVASFWVNQIDEPVCSFDVFFPTGMISLIKNVTFYKVILDDTTYYPVTEKVVDGKKIFIAKSTPIVLCWQPTWDPDPEDGVYEYAVFISSWREPKTEPNAWRYVTNPTFNAPPFEYDDWFKKWDFFVSTVIVKNIEEGTQEGYVLELVENTTYFFRIRAIDAPQNLYWIWSSTETFSPPLNENPLSFCIDFIKEPPSNYTIITPTGIVNPASLEGPIYFEWSKPKDPDPFDSVKHYFLNISTVLIQNSDHWYTLPFWKINVYLENSDISSTTVMFTLSKLCPSVTYYWQVHCWSKNEWDFALNPSTSQPYLVKPYGVALSTGRFIVSNQRPLKFNLLSPGVSISHPFASGIKTFRPTFYWEQVYDPDNYDSFVSSYVIIISSFANFSSYYTFYSSDTKFILNFDLHPRTTYYWYVKAYDKFGNFETPYSTFYFQTTNFDPNNFELVYPLNDEIVLSSFKFKFKNNGDLDRDILYYTLYISSFQNFSVYEKFSAGTNIGKQIGETIEAEIFFDFKENTQYFWQVVAYDNYGGISSSTIGSFWVNFYEENPKSFYLNITSGVIKERYINLSWQQSYDSDPKDYVEQYKVVISSAESYIVGDSTYIVILGSTTLSYNIDLSKLKENAAYYWWVEAYDTKSNYTKSISSYMFIVDLQDDPPDDIYLLSPGSSYTFTRATQPLNLIWAPANITEWWKQITYELYIGELGKPPNKVEFFLGPYENYKELQPISYSTSTLKENTTYFWYVVAKNQVSQKISTTNYLFIDSQNDPPEPFGIFSPSSTVFTRKPQFIWEIGFDKDDGINYYEIKLSTKQNFQLNITTSIVVSSSVTVYTINFKLLMNSTYYWKIRAYDKRGLWRDSSVLSFYVPYFRPQGVKILNPEGEILLRRPVFEWEPLPHPEPNTSIKKYRLKIFSNKNLYSPVIDVEVSSNSYQPQINLTQNMTYYYEVIAIDEEDIFSEPTKNTFFIGVINIPSRIEKINYDNPDYRFILSWEKVQTYTDGSLADDIKGYNIYRSQDYEGVLNPSSFYKFVSTPATTFTDYIYFNTYYYLIKVVTETGIESLPSDVVSSFNSGSRIIPFLDTMKIVIPKGVEEEISFYGYKLNITTVPVEENESINFSTFMKYKLELVRNNKPVSYKFKQPINLEIFLQKENEDYSSDNFVEEKNLVKVKPLVFFNNDIEYVLVPSFYDEQKSILRCTLRSTGEYVVRKVISTQEPVITNIYPKKIFTPTASQDNKIHFVIFNPTLFTPEGEVYDLNLRYIARLKLEGVELTWDGKDTNGNFVPKGVYIYKIKVGNKTFTGTIIVAK